MKKTYLNGEKLTRIWLTHEEFTKGGKLTIVASTTPKKTWEVENKLVSTIDPIK